MDEKCCLPYQQTKDGRVIKPSTTTNTPDCETEGTQEGANKPSTAKPLPGSHAQKCT